jgi:hypothetical protein
MKSTAIFLLASFMLAAGSAEAADPTAVTLDHGISFTLPPGWVLEEKRDTRKGDEGRLVVEIACETEHCKEETLETCRVMLFPEHHGGGQDAENLEALYADPMARYFRMRAVRIATSRDAEFRRLLAPMTIGQRDWYVVETDARHNMKSGLFADTIIGGWKVQVSCKTCETGEIRHSDATAMLASFRQDAD